MAQPIQREPAGPVMVPGFTVTAGVHGAGSSLPRHEHSRPTLCCVIHGRFTEYVPGHAMDCTTGTVKITPAAEPHWNRFAACETRGLMIEIDPDRFVDRPTVARALVSPLKLDGGEFAGLARAVLRESAMADDAGAVALEGTLLELIAGVAREAAPRAEPARPRWVSDARDIIREACNERLTLSAVAARVDVHPVTLARGFRRHFGRTVGEELRLARVERAARMLADSEEPLSRIALEAGFYDQSHFANTFRRLTGVTPGEYRRRGR